MNEALIAAPALAVALSACAVWLLRRAVIALPVDIPNARSLHARPIPRAGGYAVWIGFLPAAVVFPPAFPGGLWGWVPPWLALVAVSSRDDFRHVGVVPRLSVHAFAALWAAVALVGATSPGEPTAALVAIVAVALTIAWSTNLYNFMDGTDGLAATMGMVGFAAYGVASLPLTVAEPAPALFALAAALAPFLAVNWPRASMFLGDVGAVPIGFLAAAFGIAGVVQNVWPSWFPLLVFLPFVADATFTLVRRVRRRERLWEAHRSHFYQRLAQLGAGHGGTLAAYAGAIAGTTLSALYCRMRAPAAGWWALAAWSVLLLMLFAMIDYHWHKKTNMPAPK